MSWLRLRLLALLWPTSPGAFSAYHKCANRWTRKMMIGPIELTITHRDTRDPDGYSREELVVMLETIRKHEAIMGWKVPEPREIEERGAL